MSNSIRVLVLEDNPIDAELAIAQLTSEGYACKWDHVETRNNFLAHIENNSYDLILADFQLPSFDGLTALKLLRDRDDDLPFILISGRMGEETVIKCLKSGATDYVLKDHITRLGPVVKRALKEAQEKRMLTSAQIARAESERRYRILFEKANDAIFIIASEGAESGCIIDVNLAAAAMHGNTRSELLQMNIRELNASSDAAQFSDQLDRMVAGEWIIEETEHRKKDGTVFPVEISAGIIEIQDKRVILSLYRDISQRRREEAELREYEKYFAQVQKMEALGTLAGGIAHDFNNILSPLIGYTELCMMDLPAESGVKKNMEKVLQAAERARELVEQILVISRQREPKKQPVRIYLIIKEVIKFLSSSLPSTISIKKHLKDKDCIVIADPVQIHQMVMNLCVNSFQAMQDLGGVLTIELDSVEVSSKTVHLIKKNMAAAKYVQLNISDCGPGISQMNIDKIFDPYFSTKKEGTGLGLATVHSIVKKLGGEIIVDSMLGKGAKFSVYLPTEDVPKEPNITKYKQDVVGGDEHILVVDDVAPIVALYKEMLMKMGYRVSGFTSSRSACESFMKNPNEFNLILTDLTMPEMTGLELARTIQDSHPDIPIILSTGFSEKIPRDRAKEFGFHDVIMKPVVYKDLATCVRKALDSHQSKKQ